jgi:integrase
MPVKKSKSWSGRVYLGRDEQGQRQFHWVGRFATRRERDDAVAKARTERPWETELRPDEMTCDEWADRFLTRIESGALRTRSGRPFKRSSIDTARSSLRSFRAAFGARGPRSITRIEAEDWAAITHRNAIALAVQLMNEIYDAEGVDRNRFLGLGHRAEGRRDERPPTEDEMLLLLDGCGALGDAYAPVMRALFTFAAYTLMRPGELFAFDWDDIDLDAGAHGRARVSRRLYRGTTDLPKSNRERTITIPAPARAALDSLLAIPGYYPAGFVFRNKTGGQLTAPTLTAYWKEVRARAHLDHDFYLATKHYGVWYMKVRRGLPDAAIAAQTGWSEATVTKMVQTYAHAVDERRLDEIDAAFSGVERDADRDAGALDPQ